MSALEPEQLPLIPEATEADMAGTACYRHEGLLVIANVEHYTLASAWDGFFGVQTWVHASVSVQGALLARLADQAAIGRVRRGGERSPAPLPDWYDLTHLAYEHGRELGFDPAQPIWQWLPAAQGPMLSEAPSYLNIAEALHLRQPA